MLQFLCYMGVFLCVFVFRYLDFISVKTFDLHGGQDRVTAHHSSLYTENNANIVITLFFFYFFMWMFKKAWCQYFQDYILYIYVETVEMYVECKNTFEVGYITNIWIRVLAPFLVHWGTDQVGRNPRAPYARCVNRQPFANKLTITTEKVMKCECLVFTAPRWPKRIG